jgi:hypothetical protein
MPIERKKQNPGVQIEAQNHYYGAQLITRVLLSLLASCKHSELKERLGASIGGESGKDEMDGILQRLTCLSKADEVDA